MTYCGQVASGVFAATIMSAQAAIDSLPWSFHVAKTLISLVLVWLPFADRVPPLIFRDITAGLIARSAALLLDATFGCSTNVNSSGRYRHINFAGLCWSASLSFR